MTRRLSERPEDSSGSLVARITLGGYHPKLQRPSRRGRKAEAARLKQLGSRLNFEGSI
jgi:hypothetical protein